MRISDIDYIDGCTGEVLTEMTSEEMFEREVVSVEQSNNRMTITSVLVEDLPLYYAWEYGKHGEMSYTDFLSECTCCGGNWTRMLFSGIKRLFPKVYDAIPNDKIYTFFELVDIIEMCGVKVSD